MKMKSALIPDDLSALRYGMPHDSLLDDKFGRNRVLVDLAAQGRQILELGCATGFISRHLKERGCKVTGVEISPEAAEYARQWCDKVIVHDLSQSGWSEQAGREFDTVICGDVLEHLPHPGRTLKEIAGLLTPDGRVIISLPNIAHIRVRAKLLLGRFDYEPGGIMDVTHLRFFTFKSARELIEGAGYRITWSTPIVGGGPLTRPIRMMLPELFAGQMIFVAQRA
ncbi:MAG: class I SAM-dependent methyltransferase [Actinomycetota bacterium]